MFTGPENSLYVKDKPKYEAIRKMANGFNSNYTGSNIIQDDIFHVMENYVSRQGMAMDLFRYPFGDDDFCACAFIREGRLFLALNSAMPLAKQIFAAAHELYHLYRYFENLVPVPRQTGLFLDSATIDENSAKTEGMEANAFAGLILAPSRLLLEQMDIFRILRENIGIKDILVLMEIFAIPFRVTVCRLFEEKIIAEDAVRQFLRIPENDVRSRIELTGRAKRWMRTTEGEISFGSLNENMDRALRLGTVDNRRIRQDKGRIMEIINSITGEADRTHFPGTDR